MSDQMTDRTNIIDWSNFKMGNLKIPPSITTKFDGILQAESNSSSNFTSVSKSSWSPLYSVAINVLRLEIP